MLKLKTKTFFYLIYVLATLNSFQAQASLIGHLKLDPSLQDAAIIAMRTALGARQQTTAVRRVSFSAEMRIYIESYRELRNSNTLANIQIRYDAVRAKLLEPRLPATVEELVSTLEKL